MNYIKKNAVLAGQNICKNLKFKGEIMEEHQDLQDILLDKEEEQGTSKIRKFITTVVSLVILFLVVVIVVKFINSDSSKDSDLISNETLILPEESQMPENKPQNYNQANMAQNGSFTMPPNFETPSKPANNDELFAPVASDDGFNKPSIELKPEILEPMPSKPVDVNIKQDPEPSMPSKPEPKQQNIAKIEKPSPKPQASTQKPSTNTQIAKGTYVQVASLSTITPNNAFFKKIKDAGYSYTTYKTIVNGKHTIKVLIGPFTQGELNENIGKIKADISNSAFIYRVK